MPATGGTFVRFLRAAELLRPRTLSNLARSDARIREELDTLSSRVRALTAALDAVTLRETQLRAILQADLDFDERASRFGAIADGDAIARHVRTSIERATLQSHPFPHCVVDNLLPKEYYDALLRALPPVELFADRAANKQQLGVPFSFAPRFSKLVWSHMADVVAAGVMGPVLIDKFREPLTGWLRQSVPAVGERPLDWIEMKCSDGRILLRRPGYRIPPHRDPKWGFITCLMYLARPGDDVRWGTQLFRVNDDREARGASPHWIADTQCELVSDVEFRPNRALVFLNSVGAHGAQIPADAEPQGLERYAYQFRVGPERQSIDAIRARLSPDERPLWAGKGSDY